MSSAEYPLAPDPSVEWKGGKRRYDIVKEAVIAFVAVLLLTIGLALVFSSPDDKPVTIAQWATVGAEGLPRDGGLRARRDERRRDLRAALHERAGRRTEHHRPPVDRTAARRADPDRPRARVRDRAADDPGSHRPDTRGRAAAVGPGLARAEARLGERLREGARPGQGGRPAEPFTRSTTGRCRR